MPVRVSERVSLGGSAVEVTRVGFGTAALGNLYAPVAGEEAVAVVHRAVEAGIGYVDTAPHYGAGLSERRVGEALASLPSTVVPVLSTKAGRLVVSRPGADPGIFADVEARESVFDFTPSGIRRSLEESLERLGLGRLDIVYLHDPEDFLDRAIGEAYPVLDALRDEGVIGAVGVGTNWCDVPTRFLAETDLDVVLIAGRYTLLDQSAGEALLPACAERGVSVVVGGVFNSGILAAPRPGARFDYLPAPPEVVTRVQKLAEMCASYEVPLKAAALQFPLRSPTVASVLLGCRSVAELEQNLALLAFDVPDELWEATTGDS